jgi:bifunctional isochorismate lyase/aryl carrier protein
MKKEAYFTSENIDSLSKEWLEELSDFKKRHSIIIGNPALLILDMQEYFLSKDSHAFILSSIAIIPKISNLIKEFVKYNLPVIFTRHIDTKESQMLKWWRGAITPSDPLSVISEQLLYDGATIINKSQYDAFYKTELESILKDKGVDQVVIAGVATHLCCETTARSAFVRGFRVLLPIDTTATFNRHFHMATFVNLSHGFAIPTTSESILKFVKDKYENT